ncbi:glycine cleavage system protein H [Desulfocicer niacini]
MKSTTNMKSKHGPMVFDMTSNQCVWSKAGLMAPFPCMNAFNCTDCPLDAKMQERLMDKTLSRKQPWSPRISSGETDMQIPVDCKCRHMLSGRVSYKYCVHNYDCATCTYHQLMEEEIACLDAAPVDQEHAGGFYLAKKYYYHRGHTWARIEYGGRVRMGMDDFSMRLLGALDTLDLPSLGSTVHQGQPAMGLGRGHLKAEALSPMEGIVLAVNPHGLKRAEMAARDPYGQGWLMVIEPTRLKMNLKNLIFGQESMAWMEEESSRLAALVCDDTDYKLAATGGRAISDIYGHMPELGWDRLVKAFLLTG